jgi:hypothetical protein
MAGVGQPKTGGRARGTPNQVTAAVKEAITAAFDEVGGKDYLVEVAKSDPKVFCALLGKLLPAEIRASLDDRSAPIQIRVVTGIEFAPGEKVDDWAAQQRKAELGPGEPPSEGSDGAIELVSNGAVEMEHVEPVAVGEPPQPETWVPLRPDRNDRPTTAQLD